jgi:putative transposase
LSYANHFHLLIKVDDNLNLEAQPGRLNPLQKAFRDFFISYSKAVNKREGRTGALFQQKFKKKEIDADDYFTTLILYIHNNPVESGMCNHAGEWKYSSYNSIVSSNSPTKIKRQQVVEWFGGVEAFKQMHNNDFAPNLS